jgi:probable HAF family extracellular repeat protein
MEKSLISLKAFATLVLLITLIHPVLAVSILPVPTDLGTLPGGTKSMATDINDNGQIVGSSDNNTGFTYATLWNMSTGAITNLGSLNGGSSIALGINTFGQAVGFSSNSFFNANATYWNLSSGTITDLGTLPGDRQSFAFDVNNLGQAVGGSGFQFAGSLIGNATIWNLSTGTISSLDIPPGLFNTVATSINDAGEIVGYGEYNANGQILDHAILWNSSGKAIDLGTVDTDSRIFAIDDLEQAVGVNGQFFTVNATLWNLSTGVSTNIGTLRGRPFGSALDINNFGKVVGVSATNLFDTNAFFLRAGGVLNNGHATLWDLSSKGKITDLGTLPHGTYSFANGIDSKGEIVGYGNNATNIVHAVLWTTKKSHK